MFEYKIAKTVQEIYEKIFTIRRRVKRFFLTIIIFNYKKLTDFFRNTKINNSKNINV